jgi:phosphonate transport system substrate-binding protein
MHDEVARELDAEERAAPPGALVFGVVRRSEQTEASAAEFCGWLARATGLDVQARVADGYAELLADIVAGEIDVAWLPPLVAIDAQDQAGVTLVAVVQRRDPKGYHSALFTRADSRFQDVRDLCGAVGAWLSPESASGHFVPRWHLASRGIELAKAFREHLVFETHGAVARAVASGRADVGATHVALDPVTGELARAPWLELPDAPPMRVLLLVGPIPRDVIAAAASLPVSTRRALLAALLSLEADHALVRSLFEATCFEPVPERHLELLRRLAHFAKSGPA